MVVVVLSLAFYNHSYHSRNVLDLVQMSTIDVPQDKLPHSLEDTVDQLVKQSSQDNGDETLQIVDTKEKSEQPSKESSEEDQLKTDKEDLEGEAKDESEERPKISDDSKQKPKGKGKGKAKPNGPHWLDYEQ